jgi:hypothetical protein
VRVISILFSSTLTPLSVCEVLTSAFANAFSAFYIQVISLFRHNTLLIHQEGDFRSMRANLLAKLHFVALFPLVLLGGTLFAMTQPAEIAADAHSGPAAYQSAVIIDTKATDPINLNNQASLIPARQITRTTWPAYGPVTVLLEDQGGSLSELLPAYANGGFSSLYILKEGNSCYLWLGSGFVSGSIYNSIEQRFESEDGLVWHNRTNTNLALSNTSWRHLLGLRHIIKAGALYEGWEPYYYNVVSGAWAKNTRYVTSTNGITWTVVNQAPTETAVYPSLIKEGGIYHIWANPDVDSSYDPDKNMRYRTSSSGGSGWGHWKTGGTVINIDGSPWTPVPSRVRQGADDTYQFFYQTTSGINLATGTDGITFTTQITDLIKFSDVFSLSVPSSIGDFLVLDVQGEDWFYFLYGDTQSTHIAVSRPIYSNLYLPIILRAYSPLAFPLLIGDAISARPASYKGEIFYTTTIMVPSPLPPGGHFYLSSNPAMLAEVLVDDKIVLSVGGEEVFIYNFSLSGSPQAAIVEIPRAVMEQLAGHDVRVEYRDVYSYQVEASEMWIIWQP